MLTKATGTHSYSAFHGNNGYANAPQCYVIRTLHVLFALLQSRVNWYVYVGPVQEYRQEKAEAQGRKPIPVPLYLSQIPHGLRWDRTRASALRGFWIVP